MRSFSILDAICFFSGVSSVDFFFGHTFVQQLFYLYLGSRRFEVMVLH